MILQHTLVWNVVEWRLIFFTFRQTAVACHSLTCDQEGAAPWSSLVGDFTGVLAVALAVERPHQVASVVVALTQLAHRQQALAQLPLVAQQACRVGPQQAAGQAEGPSQRLTHLSIGWLHHRGIWRGCRRHMTSSDTECQSSRCHQVSQNKGTNSLKIFFLMTKYNSNDSNGVIEKGNIERFNSLWLIC